MERTFRGQFAPGYCDISVHRWCGSCTAAPDKRVAVQLPPQQAAVKLSL
ncbi:MAG: hypothetical protein L6306_18985 [Planctomycetales bacterium]|nr:hypothetical protein [Planctomycetales bacterium]